MSDAQGAGEAGDATVDKTYAAELRKQAGEEAAQKKARIEAAKASVAKAKATLAAQEKELAKAEKENG